MAQATEEPQQPAAKEDHHHEPAFSPRQVLKENEEQTFIERVYFLANAVAGGVHGFGQLCVILYKFLCLMYQYPTATNIAIQATYKSLKLMYDKGWWQPFGPQKPTDPPPQSDPKEGAKSVPEAEKKAQPANPDKSAAESKKDA